VRNIDIVVVESLKALDPEWPIREADIMAVANMRARLISHSLLSNAVTRARLWQD
jgi:hypothetical protein